MCSMGILKVHAFNQNLFISHHSTAAHNVMPWGPTPSWGRVDGNDSEHHEHQNTPEHTRTPENWD